MNYQYQPYHQNNPNQQVFNSHLNVAPEQPQQPTYKTQQYNWNQKNNFQTPQQQQPQQQQQPFQNVQQQTKNPPQFQYQLQQQNSNSCQQSGGQSDYKFGQPQIGNNALALPPSQNPHFQQAQQPISNLNQLSIRQNDQQPQQPQQQQSKPPLPPIQENPSNKNKPLMPSFQRGREKETLNVNPQNSVNKSDEEELFKCQAKNCAKSFMKKKSDTMTTICSDCKKDIRTRLASPQINFKCYSCFQPIINTFLTGQLCQECWSKKNEESQKNNTKFHRVMFSSKIPLGNENQQTTQDISSPISQQSNQIESINTVITPRRNWKDAQSSLVQENTIKEQEKEQSVMQFQQQQQPQVQAEQINSQNLRQQDHRKQVNNNPQQHQQEENIKEMNGSFQQRDQQQQKGRSQNNNIDSQDLFLRQASDMISSFQQQLQQISKPQEEGKAQNQNLDFFQQAQIKIQSFQQKLQQLFEQVNLQISDLQKQQNQQNVQKTGYDKQFSQPGYLTQQRAQQTSPQRINPQSTNYINQYSSSNQLNNQNNFIQTQEEFSHLFQPNKLQIDQQTSDNRQPQTVSIQRETALDRPLQNQAKDQLQEPSVLSFGNGFNNILNNMNRGPQSQANVQGKQNQSNNEAPFMWKAPQQAGETNTVNLKTNFEYKDKQQYAFSLANNQFQSYQSGISKNYF